MSKILLVDFSQTVISACAAQAKEFKGIDNDSLKQLVKHTILNMLLAWKAKFKPYKMILACDSKSYWRKDEFPYYKGHRKHEDDDFLNWTVIYETLDEMKVELKENFPYILLEIAEAEADDVIATLCAFFQENDLVDTGLIEEPREIVIVSTDGDFQQLQKYHGVSQWNNVQKKFLKCDNPKQYLIEHIVMGDTGDNVPSIPNGDDWAKARMDDVPFRAKPFKKARLSEFYHKGIDACVDDVEKRNWKRNERLVDLDFIPTHINNSIISEYLNYEPQVSRRKIMHYLMGQRMKLLINHVNDF